MLSNYQRKIAIDIFKKFQLFSHTQIEDMKKTNHHYNKEKLNSYHLEGDVFTHTCLVFNTFLNTNFDEDLEIEILTIAMLCHDIGKIYKREENDETERVSFYNHSYASIQFAIDFTNHLYGYLPTVFINNLLEYILPLISNHINFRIVKKRKRDGMLNYNLEMLKLSKILDYCDSNGSIVDNIERNEKEIDYNIKKNNSSFSQQKIYIMSGVPGAGKDYVAEKMNLPIISFDKIRVAVFKDQNIKDKNIWETWSDELIYSEAWNFCNEKKIDLMKYVVNKVKKYREQNIDVIISNTSLTNKSRKILINTCGKARYISLYVVADSQTIFKRNKERELKKIPHNIVKKFMLNQQVPTMADGFDEVRIILNEDEV